MIRIFLTLIMVLVMFLGTAAPGWSGEVSLKARPGLAGIYKINQTVPIRVDVENRGEAVAGELVVLPRQKDMENPGIRNAPVYRSQINIPAGGRASIHMVVPGEIAANAGSIRLISGEMVLAESSLEGAAVAGGIVILPLGEKISGSSLFKWMDKTYGGQVTVKYLPAGELPEKALHLEGADIIVADREAASKLNDSQLKALKDWVILGGTLILSGEEGTVTAGPFREIGPEPGKEVSRKTLGKGTVILSRTPIQDIQDPDGKIWQTMLSAVGAGPVHNKEIDVKNMESGMLSEMGSYFPMIKIPDISVLILLWIVYTLVIGPGTYLVLKRYNRRDLSWVIIPALSLAAGLALFLMSPVNRVNSYMAHNMSTIEIIDPSLAQVKTAGTFVLPKGGSLEVRGAGETLVQPVNIYGNRGQPVWVFSGTESRIVFNSVEYGSMRQVNSYGTLANAGMLGGSVYFRDDRVMGEIINNTPFNLRDCRLLVGAGLVELGELPAGSGKKLNEPLGRSLVVTDPKEYRVDSKSPVPARESRFIADFTMSREASGDIYFLGWSDSPTDNLQVVRPGGQGQTSGLTMVRQRMEPVFPPGPFKLPSGLIKNTVTGIDGGYSWRPEGLMVHRGSVKITYDLKKTLDRTDFSLTGIELPPVADKTNYLVEIFRQDLSQWEPVAGSGQKISGSEVLEYISGQGKIEVKLTSPVENPGVEGAFRGIAVEGVIAQ